MIVQLFLKLTDYPAIRQILSKGVHQTQGKKIKPLNHEDEINRYSLQLYNHLVSMVDVSGTEIRGLGTALSADQFQ